MLYPSALALLQRHTPLPFDWCEVVAGYDFGILSIREIQDWIRSTAPLGPEAERLANLEGSELLCFEATLWAACVEATGVRVPRPGHARWALAQDLWRTALLKETLSWSLSEREFEEAIEMITDRVGCPEDMLGLLQADRHSESHRTRVETFVKVLESRLRSHNGGWIHQAAS